MTKLELTRGDTHVIRFQRRDGTGTVVKEQPKNIWFTVKADPYQPKPLIQKRLSNGSIVYDEETQYYHFVLLPSDTDGLKMNREYDYDIEVKTVSDIKTIAKGKLLITYEVTHAADEVMDDG